MIRELLRIAWQEIMDNPILLEDYAGESGAVYCAVNPD